MGEETLKQKTAKGLLWGGLSNGIQQLLTLVFGVVLARLLTQADYGMVGMLTVFTSLATALQEGGFVSALNRRRNVTGKDYNAVFWTSTLMSLCFYVLLFFSAPLIARFYGKPELVPLSRYVFLTILVGSMGVAPSAFMFRNMMVRQKAVMMVVSVLAAGTVGTVLALLHYAYWAIATQSLVYIVVITLLTYYYSGWRPSLSIDFRPVGEMIGFSSKLIVTNVFNIINNNIFPVVLGRFYTSHVVGNYTQASKWSTMGWSLVSSMLYNIAQPVFTRTEDDAGRQKKIFRKLLRFTAFVSFPALFGLALVSREFIVILLTEKWAESAAILQMLCVAGAFSPLSFLFSNLIISRGHSTVYMWSTIGLCLVQLAGVLVSARHGMQTMLSVYVVISVMWLFVWHYFARREIDLRLIEVAKDVLPYLGVTAILVVLAQVLAEGIANLYLSLLFKVGFVATGYCLVLWALKSTIFKESVDFIMKRRIVQ